MLSMSDIIGGTVVTGWDWQWQGPLNILHWWISLLSLHETFHLWTNWDILSMIELNKQGMSICSSEITKLKRPWHNVSNSCSIRRENGVLDDHTQCMYVIWNSWSIYLDYCWQKENPIDLFSCHLWRL